MLLGALCCVFVYILFAVLLICEAGDLAIFAYDVLGLTREFFVEMFIDVFVLLCEVWLAIEDSILFLASVIFGQPLYDVRCPKFWQLAQ